MQLCGSLSILWHCFSLGMEWKLTFSSQAAELLRIRITRYFKNKTQNNAGIYPIKTGTLEKTEGKRRGWAAEDEINSITVSIDMSLSKLHVVIKDREVWYATVYGVAKSQTWLSDWTTTIYPSEVKNPHSHKAFPWIFVAALFVVTNTGNQPRDFQLQNGQANSGTSIHKTGGSLIWYNHFGKLYVLSTKHMIKQLDF